jgi:hypothetical protein
MNTLLGDGVVSLLCKAHYRNKSDALLKQVSKTFPDETTRKTMSELLRIFATLL